MKNNKILIKIFSISLFVTFFYLLMRFLLFVPDATNNDLAEASNKIYNIISNTFFTYAALLIGLITILSFIVLMINRNKILKQKSK